MPRRKRCHGRKKSDKNGDTSSQKLASVPQTSRFQSQPVTPTPASQVSTAKPAQYEAAVSKPTPASSAKVPTVSSATGPAGTGVKPSDPVKDKAQSTTVPSSKPGPVKVDPPVGKPSATAGAQKQTSAQKVQVEVGPPGTKVSAGDVDPFDALSGTLPSSQPLAPKVPTYTGPEVKEPSVKAEKGVICGERDDTLPPGYRKEDLEKKKPAGVPEKPKDVPKPISTDDALESLSAGFVSSAPTVPKKTDVKTETIGAVDVRSAGISNFAPPPPYQPKQPATSQPASVTKSPAPPADKKAKLDISTQPTKPKTDGSDSSMSLDALSALGDTLGAPEPPKKLPELKPGQIVDEKKQTSEKGVRVGERDDTLPPEYRFSEEDLKKYPPPKKEPSLNTDDALDILSGGFTTPAAAPVVKASVPPAQETKKPATVPGKTKDVPKEIKKPAGVPEKTKDVPKHKVDDFSAMDALAGDFVAPAKSASKVSSAVPPGPKQKPQIDEDPFSALGDTLGVPEPPKKQPELKPEDIVHEKGVTSEKGVRVGERDDTLPPDYRFSEEDLKKYPPPKKEPSLNTDDALDILSGGFTTPAAAPVVKASVPPAQETKKPATVPGKTKDVPKEIKKPAGVPEKTKDVPKHKVDEFSAMDALAGDFVAPAKSASKVSSAVPPGPKQKPQIDEDPFSALGDTLGVPEPPKKQPELKPEDIVHEKGVTSEKGVRVGERDDTLPPDYRFSEEDLKKYPPPKKEPSLNTDDALDILSGGFTTPAAAPVVKASVPPAQPSDSDFALDALAGEFVAASSASKVQSAVSGPPHADRQLSEGSSSALDALSDTLGDIKAAPQPAPVPPKAIVKEKDIVEEKVSKPGERDDTLPPDHRFKEEDRKAFEAAKQKDVKPKQTSMDDTTALDMLSSDFSATPAVKPSAPDAKHFTPKPTPPTHKAEGPVLEELAGKLIPNLTDPKAKDSKPKAKGGKPKSKPKKQSVEDSSAIDQQPGKVSSDVVPKGGNR